MTAIIARHNGDFMIKSTETGQLALITAEEWAALVRRIKSGHLDYTLPDGKLTQASTPKAVAHRRGLDLADVLRERIKADDVCRNRTPHSSHDHNGNYCLGMGADPAVNR